MKTTLVALLLLLACGCGKEDPALNLYQLRNRAKLHADRDTQEGYREAARLARLPSRSIMPASNWGWI